MRPNLPALLNSSSAFRAWLVNTFADKNSPKFRGIPTAPTALQGNFSTQIATTEYALTAVQSAVFRGIAIGFSVSGYTNSTNLVVSDIEGLRLDTETAITSIATGPMIQGGVGASSSTSGYVMGGAISNFAVQSGMYAFRFYIELYTSIAAVLGAARGFSTSAMSTLKGYVVGGYGSAGATTGVGGIVYSTETAVTLATGISPARLGVATLNSQLAGYSMGGNGTSVVTTKLRFATEVISNTSNTMSTGLRSSAPIWNANKGYALGGTSAGINTSGGQSNTINGLDFSSETGITPLSVLPTAQCEAASFSSILAGYMVHGGDGGSGNGYSTSIKFLFNTETTMYSTIVANTYSKKLSASLCQK